MKFAKANDISRLPQETDNGLRLNVFKHRSIALWDSPPLPIINAVDSSGNVRDFWPRLNNESICSPSFSRSADGILECDQTGRNVEQCYYRLSRLSFIARIFSIFGNTIRRELNLWSLLLKQSGEWFILSAVHSIFSRELCNISNRENKETGKKKKNSVIFFFLRADFSFQRLVPREINMILVHAFITFKM